MATLAFQDTRIALFQMEDRGSIGENINAAQRTILSCSADFICFPEFFTIPEGYVVGGTVVERDENSYHNTCFIFRNGRVVAKYRKMSPTEKKVEIGIKPEVM